MSWSTMRGTFSTAQSRLVGKYSERRSPSAALTVTVAVNQHVSRSVVLASDRLADTCHSAKEIEAQYAVNVFGVLRMLRAVLPFMRAQRSGVVCNMGSVGGWRGTPIGGLYCSTKFALVGITQSLKAEVVPLGIDVTIVEPGELLTLHITYS